MKSALARAERPRVTLTGRTDTPSPASTADSTLPELLPVNAMYQLRCSRSGIHVRAHTSVRKIKTGMETIDVFAFLTTALNAEVGEVHPKAMPVVLTEPDEIEAWMTAPWETAQNLQRPLPDGALVIFDASSRKPSEQFKDDPVPSWRSTQVLRSTDQAKGPSVRAPRRTRSDRPPRRRIASSMIGI